MTGADETANQLFRQGTDAFNSGRPREAEECFRRHAELVPDKPDSHNFLARICLRQARMDEAEQHAHQALAIGGGQPALQDTMIHVLTMTGRGELALAEYRKAADANPDDFGAAYGCGALLAQLGREAEALRWMRRALQLNTDFAVVRLRVIQMLIMANRFSDALKEIDQAFSAGDRNPTLHNLAGLCFFKSRRPKKAEAEYRRAIERAGNNRDNYVGLAATLALQNKLDEAREATSKFIERFPSFSLKAPSAEARVLVPGALGGGFFNKLSIGHQAYQRGNTISQIPADRFTFHMMFINHPDPVAVARSLGPIDVIFNNVANAEVAIRNGYTQAVRRLAEALEVPVINAPEAVELTTRERNAKHIPANFNADFPRTIYCEVPDDGHKAVAGTMLRDLSLPVLVRFAITHGDDKVLLIREAAEFEAVLAQRKGKKLYVIEYLGEEYLPGVFRKIRAVLIDRKFYPVRVDFSPHWNAHRYAAQKDLMESRPDLTGNEQEYLRDPGSYLGQENIETLEALARDLDLDFLGVDLDLRAGGRMLIFEANPAMNTIEHRQVQRFPYFADHWRRTRDALEEMILRKAGKL